jgi:DNA gyrase/topoisomerase IV subunit A
MIKEQLSKTKKISAHRIRVKHFMNSAFKEFSLYDNVRSIPVLFDGMKPSQRKAVYGVQLRGENAPEIQVERLAAQVAACLAGETLITLADGSKKTIQEISQMFSEGFTELYVKSYNAETGKCEIQPVLNAYQTKIVDEIYELELENGQTVKLTGDHKVLTSNGWKTVDKLSHDEKLINHIGIKSIKKMAVNSMPVFDMFVANTNSMICGDIVLHNCTDYHHGTGSMESTIIGMANNYAGTNNMNVFIPSGQFGSRLTKDAAAGRYIFTKFSPYFRQLFKKEDDSILDNIIVDGEKIEPKNYIPLLPFMLVNGAQGTGTGHACLIMNYHPNELRDAIIKLLNGKKLKPGTLVPWYNGFKGTIERNQQTGQVVVKGVLEVVNSTTIHVSELPIGVYLDQYKEHLYKLEEAGLIKDFEDRSTEDGFDFMINVPRSTTQLDHDTLMQKFKLISRDTENLTLWNENGTLERFDTVEDIIERFTGWRLARYEDRRQKLIGDTTEQIRWLNEKLRFILFYLDHVNDFKGKKKEDLIALLLKNDFIDYDRLLQMPMWNLTKDKIDELKNQIADQKKYLAALQSDTATEMYKRELKEFEYIAS